MSTWHLPTHHIGRRVLVFDAVDSTNSVAAELAADSANDGVAVLADQQTAGRGQYGRTWHSPPRAGVWMSVLLFPPPAVKRPVILTAWAAVAVAETVRHFTGRMARIKWPNDVLLRGRKVCGILIEQKMGTIAGIGLNVTQTAEQFAEAGLPEATSLAAHSDRSLDRDTVARQLLEDLDASYQSLLAGNLALLESCWKWHTGLLGHRVVIEMTDGTHHRGRLTEQSFAGLNLEQSDGTELQFQPESVRQVHPVE